jgi:hypothetical protein
LTAEGRWDLERQVKINAQDLLEAPKVSVLLEVANAKSMPSDPPAVV